MIINVIPFLRLSRNLHDFSYEVSKDLQGQIKLGQIVEVDFRNKKCAGLVTKVRNYKSTKLQKQNYKKYKLKVINKILYPQSLITKQQIKLIKQIADFYAVSSAIVARSMVPKIPQKHKSIKTKKQKKIKTKKQSFNKELFWWSSLEERNKKYLEIIKQNKNKQVLILVPEVEQINKLIKDLNLKENNVIKIHSGIAKTKFFLAWQQILSGQPKIIMGTKISVLLPFSNLGSIIIDYENDADHKQSDINPRYDARQLAQWLAQENKCQLLLATPAPRVESYHSLKQKNIKTKKHENTKLINYKNISVVDLKLEQNKGNYSFFSEKLLDEIKDKLSQNKQIFLFYNRKGMSGFIYCADCGFIFKCPECNISFNYYNQTKKMLCHHCGLSQDMPPLCPKCHGANIKFKGQGIEKVALDLKKHFPHAEISLVYKNSSLQNISQGQIILGTEYALNKLDFKKIGLISILRLEQLTSRPDFRAQEKAFQFILNINAISNCPFIIQTYEAKSILMQSLKQNKPQIFYKDEIKNRQELNYPPFSKLIKIISQDKSQARSYYLVDQLKKTLKNKNYNIAGPLPAIPLKTRGLYKYHLIIKMPVKSTVRELQKLYKIIPTDFLIDTEPNKIS